MIIKFFGQLTDITGTNCMEIEDAYDTNDLINRLQIKYPALQQINYKVAVNRNIIQSNTTLQSNAEIALLPPFSGG